MVKGTISYVVLDLYWHLAAFMQYQLSVDG